MNLKILFVINDDEKRIKELINKFKLPFNTLIHGIGTASQGILDFLGLAKTEKNILISIIPDILEKGIMSYFRLETNIKEFGKGVAFTVPLSSSPKYVKDSFKERVGDIMEKKSNCHLIMVIANEGSSDRIMNSAKKAGANGGTLIKGRSMGGKNSFKFFNVTVEPEKDLLLIVCKNEENHKIMESILEKNGMNTESKALVFSLPIDSTAGFE